MNRSVFIKRILGAVIGIGLCSFGDTIVNAAPAPAAAPAGPVGPVGDLTVTVSEQANGNVNFQLSGSATVKNSGNLFGTPLSGGPGDPPFSAKSKGANLNLSLSNNTAPSTVGIQGLRPDGGAWYLSFNTSYSFNVNDVITPGAAASDTTNLISFSSFTAGTFIVIDDVFDFTYIVIPYTAPAAVQAATGAPATPEQETVLVANANAIQSAQSGLAFVGANQAALQNIGQTALGDLGGRLFSARSRANAGGGIASTMQNSGRRGGSGVARFLNFAGEQNIDYRVALGLADGKEVEMVDTLAGSDMPLTSPFAMAGAPMAAVAPIVTKAVVVDVDGSGKNSFDAKGIVPDDLVESKFEVFSEFNFGFYDQDNLTTNIRGFDVDSYAATIGFEYDILPWLRAGVAWSHAWSNAELTSNLGSVDVEGQLATVYASAFRGNTWADVLYSYGDFDNDMNRNTLIGSRAIGATESHSHNLSANAGHNIRVNQSIVMGPTTGVNYSTGQVDGYTERGGGLANLIFPDSDYESLIGRVGWNISHTREAGILGQMTTQLRAGWAHEFTPEADTYSASLETSPFALVTGGSVRSVGDYTATDSGAHPGQDWLEIGTGVRFDMNQSWNVRFDYEGQFLRNNASGHFGTVRVGYEW